jgi:DNA-binding IclR family transcriptional regulator
MDGAGVTDLADELNYAQSAVHAQLNTLRQNGLVIKDGDTYRLSLQFLELAQHVVSRFGNFDIIRSEVDSLAEETGEVAQFAAREGGEIVYLYQSKGENAVKTGSFMGKREALHSTGMGKAILSATPTEKLEEIVSDSSLPRMTENTATTREELFERLNRARERGYAIDNEEHVLGLRCVAVPVMATEEEPLGAVNVTGPASRMTDERFESEIVDIIERSVNIIELNYKFS